jgi:CheY-like chemotaxis protein
MLILIADDDYELRTMLRRTLEGLGHACVEASNGQEAITLYNPETIHAVMTDIIMPQQEGLETIQILKRKNPNAKIIAMSGGGKMSAGGYLKMAQQLGASTVLSKPFSKDELESALKIVAGAG